MGHPGLLKAGALIRVGRADVCTCSMDELYRYTI